MVAQEFLRQECRNLRALLEKTLRYEYGPVGSKDFYDECVTRLDFLEQEIGASTDLLSLGQNTWLLNDLAQLICRLERSSISEYSWPFVHELKKIATAICTEDTLAGTDIPNKIYVLADGGLDSYRIHPEQRRPSYTHSRLLTIVFPKSLKQFVLLHAILGHELGHAIWRCSKHQKELKEHVEKHLKEGHFATPGDTAAHLFSSAVPQEVKDIIGHYNVDQPGMFQQFADWNAWCEEVLCDLIGLVIFGPSFIASECEMLYTLGYGGTAFGPKHPVPAWRLNYMLAGARILGYDTKPAASHTLAPIHDKFWLYMESFRKSDSWYNVFTDDQLRRALTGLKTLLGRYAPSEYSMPSEHRLEQLVQMLTRRIPPVGFSITPAGKLQCESVDFRHILLAGWMVKASHPEIPVLILNQLCEHAIMQQRAIDISLA
jgi:hypothetical protein